AATAALYDFQPAAEAGRHWKGRATSRRDHGFASEQGFALRRVIRGALTGGGGVVLDSALGGARATRAGPLVHRLLHVEISPDGKWVASVEGDSPVIGNDPPVRQLVIRPVDGKGETRIKLPCGQVEECWPGSPTWDSDSRHLSFTLRRPGSHRYSAYTV